MLEGSGGRRKGQESWKGQGHCEWSAKGWEWRARGPPSRARWVACERQPSSVQFRGPVSYHYLPLPTSLASPRPPTNSNQPTPHLFKGRRQGGCNGCPVMGRELVLLTAAIGAVLGAAAELLHADAPSWPVRSSPPTSSQSVHSTLLRVEGRLRSLENLKYAASRWDHYLDSLSRGLESLDQRARTIEIKLSNLEAQSQKLVSYEMKNDLNADQIQRQADNNQDRLLQRITYTENRFDTAVTKLKENIEVGLEKVESRQTDVKNRLETMGTTLDEIKIKLVNLEQRGNSTNLIVNQFVKEAQNSTRRVELSKMTTMLEGIERHINRSIMVADQSDEPRGPSIENQLTEVVKNQLSTEAHRIGSKVNNMYNDLWRKALTIERLVKDLAANTSNKTRDEIQSSMEEQQCSEAIENLMEITVGGLGENIHRKLSELGERLDSNLQGVMHTHSMLMGACSRHDDDSSTHLETKLTLVLEKILETIDNRSLSIDKQLIELLEAIKSHNSQIGRTVAYNTNLVKRLADDTSIEHKNLDNTILELAVLINQIFAYRQEMNSFGGHEDNDEDSEDDKEMGNIDHIKEENIINLDQNIPTSHPESEQEMKALVANYSNGILRVLTDLPDEKANDRWDKRLPEGQNLTDSEKFLISLGLLNQTINMENLTVIINEPTIRRFDEYSEENSTRSTNETVTNNATEYNSLSETDSEPEEGELLLRVKNLFKKVVVGNIDNEKFLELADPGHKFSSIQELIKELRKIKNPPEDLIKELEDWDILMIEKKMEETILTDLKEDSDEDYYVDSESE